MSLFLKVDLSEFAVFRPVAFKTVHGRVGYTWDGRDDQF